MSHAPNAKPDINEHRTAQIAYRVPPKTKANCRIQISSYTRLAAPETNKQKKGISLDEVVNEEFIFLK